MKKRNTIIFGAVTVAFIFILSGTLALAKHGGELPPGQAKKHGSHKFYDEEHTKKHGHHEYSHHEEHTNSSTPPGWQHGKKTGWHGGKYPPGWSKWDKQKRSTWTGDRDHAIDEIRQVSVTYRIPAPKQNEITSAFNQAIAGGLVVNDAKDRLVNALKDENSRRGLMIDTTKSVLDLYK